MTQTTPHPLPRDPRRAPIEASGEMTHREVLEALSGLLLAMFVAMLSSTVVTNALPRIVTDLHGSQTGYTWVVVATLLAMTATTPIWGKLADLFSKKLLVQRALVIYSVGSLIAAFAPNMEVLIGARVVQGLGVGGLTALVQVVIASMVTPRERGRYSGYIGATFALATVSGPLIGGVIVDSPLGWRGCFFVGLPVARARLRRAAEDAAPAGRQARGPHRLPRRHPASSAASRSCWSGSRSPATSSTGSPPPAARMVVGGLAVIAAAMYVEAQVAVEPIIPLRLFKDRTMSLATVASVLIGVAMFGSTVYLSQYFQLARGMSPTEAGLMSIAMVGGLLVSSIVTGRIISETGLWKRYLVGGMVLGHRRPRPARHHRRDHHPGRGRRLHGGPRPRPRRHHAEPRARRCRTTSPSPTWARPARWSRSSARWAARSASPRWARCSATRSPSKVADRAGRARHRRRGHEQPAAIPDLATLPAPVRAVFEHAFGEATGHIFLVAVPFAVLALVCVAVHPRGAAAHHDGPRARPRSAPMAPCERRGAAVDGGRPMTSRADSLRASSEVGVLIRRIRRVIGERARAVHPDLQPASYLMLA